MKIINKTDLYKCNCVLWLRVVLPELPTGLWTLDDKRAIINSSKPVVGSGAMSSDGVWFTHEGKKVFSGHVAFVKKVDKDVITIREANYRSCTVTEREGTMKELKLIGFFVPDRLKTNEETMKEIKKAVEKIFNIDVGKNINDNEDKKVAEAIYRMEEELEEANANATSLFTQNKNLILEREGLIKAQDKLSKAHDLELKRTKESLTANYKEQLRLKNDELEECIENAQCIPVTEYSWARLLEIAIKKLNINMKK